MLFSRIVPAPKSALSLRQALELTNAYLENAYKSADLDVALILCRDAEIALSRAKSTSKEYPAGLKDASYQSLRDGIAAAYIDLGKLLEKQGYKGAALNSYKKAEKWG